MVVLPLDPVTRAVGISRSSFQGTCATSGRCAHRKIRGCPRRRRESGRDSSATCASPRARSRIEQGPKRRLRLQGGEPQEACDRGRFLEDGREPPPPDSRRPRRTAMPRRRVRLRGHASDRDRARGAPRTAPTHSLRWPEIIDPRVPRWQATRLPRGGARLHGGPIQRRRAPARSTRARQAAIRSSSAGTARSSSTAPGDAKNRLPPVRRRESSNGSAGGTLSRRSPAPCEFHAHPE